MTPVLRNTAAADLARAATPNRAATVITALLAAALGLIFFSGCSQFDIRKNIPWLDNEDAKYTEPSKVIVMWTDAVLNQSERKSVRGFGGRLYFYAKDPKIPIKVKGNLVIYGFDETDRKTDNVVPDKKFVFTADQLQKHCSTNEVGPSYSFWIPWDEIGGQRKEISLIARFSSEKGGLVISEQTKAVLPGSRPPEKPAAADLPALLQNIPGLKPAALNAPQQYPGVQTSYEQAVMPAASAGTASSVPASHNTATIPLPSNRLSWLRQNATNDDPNILGGAEQNLPQTMAATKSGAVGGIGTRGVAASAPSSSQSIPENRPTAPPAPTAPAVSLPQGINAPPWNPGTQARATVGPTAALNAPVGRNWSASPAIGMQGIGSNPAAPWNSPTGYAGPVNGQPYAANPMGSSLPAQGLPPSQTMAPMQPAGSGAWNNPAAFTAPAQTLQAPAIQLPSSSF